MSRDSPQKQLDQILALVRDVLGPDVIGVYLHGSAVFDGLRPLSDIDLLALSTRRTTPEEKRRLVDRLLTISGGGNPLAPSRPIELTIVVESEVRPWRYPPSFDFQYGDWLREEFESGNVEPWPTTTNPDLASLITMVLLANKPLLGPPPQTGRSPGSPKSIGRCSPVRGRSTWATRRNAGTTSGSNVSPRTLPTARTL